MLQVSLDRAARVDLEQAPTGGGQRLARHVHQLQVRERLIRHQPAHRALNVLDRGGALGGLLDMLLELGQQCPDRPALLAFFFFGSLAKGPRHVLGRQPPAPA